MCARDLVRSRVGARGFKGLRALLPGLKVAPNEFIHRSSALALSQQWVAYFLFTSVHSFFYNALVDFTAPAIRLRCIIYFIIMHLSPFGYNGFVHNLYFFTTCTAGKKELAHRNSEQNALGTHRERIGRAWVELERVRPKNWQRRLFAAGHAEMLQNIGVKSSPGKKERMHAWAHPQHLLCSFFPSL